MKKTIVVLLVVIFLGMVVSGCGSDESTSTSTESEGTLFTGYVPGKKVTGEDTGTGNEEIPEEKGLFFTINDKEIVVPMENVNIIEQQTFTFIGGDVEIDDVTYTINFTFMQSVSYPHTYNLVTGTPGSQDDAVFFYQQAVSGGTVKTIQTVKDGFLVIESYNDQEITGTFWARVGLDDGEDLYITNGKINLER